MTKNTTQLVQDRKTGIWYDPEVKMQELMKAQWFIDVMIRLKLR